MVLQHWRTFLITFKQVRWKNFLSTGNTFTEIELDRNSTTLIIGENGAGKSTILDALCFGLFGKGFRSISKPLLVNSVNGSGTLVEVEFEIGSKRFRVRRGIKPNVFEIYVDGKMYNQDANARDYQKHLEQQILKLNYRSFTQVVILGSSTFIPFMQLRARYRREVVEEILDIQIFSLMNVLLKGEMKTLIEHIREIEYEKSLCEEKIELQKQYIGELKKNKNKTLKEKVELLAGNEEEIFMRQGESDLLTKENDKLIESIADKTKLDKKLSKLNDIKSTLTEKHKSHSTMIGFFETNDDCPTCEQHIDEKFKDIMINSKQMKASELMDGLNSLEEELVSTKDRLIDIKEIAKSVRENEVQIARNKSSVDQLEKFNKNVQHEMDELSQEGGVTKKDNDKLVSYEKDLVGVDASRSKLKEEMIYSEATRNMLQDTGIKTKIIKQYLPIMNRLINTYLTSMEFYVNFTLNENFEETIKSRYRDEFTYASFSEGEKMRIDLALLFTWRAIAKMKNSTNTNLLILDEIFDSSLDATGTDEFLKILNTLEGENVFVISHKQDMLVDKFNSTIRFEKQKNFSHIME